VTITCEGCGKDVERPFIQRGRRFCSYSCSNKGKNNTQFGLGKEQAWNKVERWSKGLTATTDNRLAEAGRKISAIVAQKMVDGAWSPPVTHFKASHFESKKCDKTFYCRSSYERCCL
jgi:hypothetical protein